MGIITEVTPGSAADRAGIERNDRLIAIDGNPISDIIDYQFHSAEVECEFELERNKHRYTATVSCNWGEDIGISFADGLFDGLKRCNNRCAFCFVDQMPPGLRSSLYVKDDDFRLSFLQGCYVTLTNLTDDDADRIIYQRLSPLYVSVHAVSADIRKQLLGGNRTDTTIELLKRFASNRMELHCQIVVCPGYNDEDELERTLRFLYDLGPSVTSVAIVPVGLTTHRTNLPTIESVDEKKAIEILDTVSQFQQLWRGRDHQLVVQASDEIYLTAGRKLPTSDHYEQFVQLENGVGLVTLFKDELGSAPLPEVNTRTAIVTGNLFAPVLQEIVNPVGIDVIAVDNYLFGHTVTVAGLLGGNDIIAAVNDAELAPETDIYIPDICIRQEDRDRPLHGLLVDDVRPVDIAQATNRNVTVIPATGAALRSQLEEASI